MREKQTLAAVQLLKLSQILPRKLKIKHIKILLHALLMRGFRNQNDILLQQKINILCLQLFQGLFNGSLRLLVSRIANPYFCCVLWKQSKN